jgi:hypothetical protein
MKREFEAIDETLWVYETSDEVKKIVFRETPFPLHCAARLRKEGLNYVHLSAVF